MKRLKRRIKSRAHAYALIGAATGLIGSANAVLLGIYIIIYCLRLKSWSASFLTWAYIVGIATAASAFILICGGYLMLKGRPLLGGILNIIAGYITTILYLYFTWSFPLLGQLGPMGYFLLVPALMSGLIGILIPKT